MDAKEMVERLHSGVRVVSSTALEMTGRALSVPAAVSAKTLSATRGLAATVGDRVARVAVSTTSTGVAVRNEVQGVGWLLRRDISDSIRSWSEGYRTGHRSYCDMRSRRRR